jgi:hypothetical protein
VTIAAQGFRGWQQTEITVNPGDVRNVNGIALSVGSANQTVTVDSSASE